MENRAFSGPSDLRGMQRLAQDVWRLKPTFVDTTVGQLAWTYGVQHGAFSHEWRIRLWLDGDDVKAWGWISLPSTLEWLVHPRHPELTDQVLDWFETERSEEPSLRTTARAANEEAIGRLHRRGFRHDPEAPWMILSARGLAEIPEPSVPEGFKLRTMDEVGDVAARVAGHRAAWIPSRVTEESYASVMSTWPYQTDLDFVVQAPDGSVASSAIAWFDEENGVAEFEPVGTHTEYRRLGLARALSLFGLQRLREAGARQAIVGSRGDADYPIPKVLYESVGFRELSRQLRFVRA